jgi:hypothetical protein
MTGDDVFTPRVVGLKPPEGVNDPVTTRFPVTVAFPDTVAFPVTVAFPDTVAFAPVVRLPLGSSVILTVVDDGFWMFVALRVDINVP